MVAQKKGLFEDYAVHKVSGGNNFHEKPLFCKKGKNILVSIHDGVHIYSTSTGEHLSELLTCPSQIIGLQTDPADEDYFLIYTITGGVFRCCNELGSENSEICKLVLDAKVLNEQKVRKFSSKFKDVTKIPPDWSDPVENVTFLKIMCREGLIYASWALGGAHASHLSVFDSKSGKQLNIHPYPSAVLQKSRDNFVIGRDFLAAMGESSIYVMKLSTDENISHPISSKTIKFTQIVSHPEEAVFATGDSLGRIIVWKNIHDKKTLRDVHHWHTLPVRSLIFTECGTHLFSGGDENVLVKWSLANRQKNFLPRLSSNIHQLSIAEGSSLLSVSTTDAKILIVNIGLVCVSTIQHFSRWSTVGVAKNRTILSQDPRTDALVLAGKTGHLQMLSPNGEFLCTFDVTQRNFLTKERNTTPQNVEVIFAQFTREGKWLVTAEASADECRLKFWAFDTEKQEFSLNTDVDAPHGAEPINALQVSTTELAATCGSDCHYRLWAVVETTYLQKVKLHWAQITHCGYRQLPCGALDFSRDASLLAAGFGPALTLWDTSNATLKASLTPPLVREPITAVKFGNHSLSHLVVTGTANALTCWNIVTLSRQWLVPVNLSLLVSDPNSRFMCAFTTAHSLFIFDPSSAKPELRLNQICDQPVTAAVFVAKTDAPYLYFLSKKQILYNLGRKDLVNQPSGKSNNILTPYSAQIAENIRKDVVTPHGLTRVTDLKKFTAGILDSPAHTLPRVSLFCEDVLASFLLTVHVSENRTNTSQESNPDSFEALQIPTELSEADFEVEVDHLFAEN